MNNKHKMAEKEMSKEEKIGFHKGSISTLVAERNEILRLVQVTEALIQAHAKELEKLGVKINMGGEQKSREKSRGNLDNRVP